VPVTPSASYSLTLRVALADEPGMLGLLTSAIGRAGGSIGAIDIVRATGGRLIRDIAVDARDQEHWQEIISSVRGIDGVELVEWTDRTFRLHFGGKIEQINKSPLKTRDDLSMAYTPGVARVCSAIHEDPELAFRARARRHRGAGGVAGDGG
jgi:malate dehydrogenase (oxaloacetate-decarboxylating)